MEATRTSSTPLVVGGARDHTPMGQQEGARVQEKMAAMQIQSGHGRSGDVSLPPAPAPLTLPLRNNNASTFMEEDEPDSPTSPSCNSPNGYPPLVKRAVDNREEYNYSLPGIDYTCRATEDAFQSIQDDDEEPPFPYCLEHLPSSSLDLHALHVKQSTEYAETALRYHNEDPNNEVKYELIKATESSYILEGRGGYGHVNFIAKAKQEGSEEQLFFAELLFRDDITLTCFCCLKEKEDQVGGLIDMDGREGKRGADLKHCYACCNALKHPRDGASYYAGHWTGRLRYDCP